MVFHNLGGVEILRPKKKKTLEADDSGQGALRQLMSDQRIQELLKFYAEHTDQEFVKKILEALREGQLTEHELVEIGDWIAKHSKRLERECIRHDS